MSRTVRAALLQATWTGDKESMIQKHERYVHDAAAEGAKLMLFQELFYGPYFCQVQDTQYYRYTEHIPDGPTTKRMQALAKETGMVLVVPMYEEDSQTTGIYYNTAAVIDADGKFLGKYRKTHIPHVQGFWEKFYFRPGNLGYPVFETAVGKVGVYICYDRHFPEGARALGLNGAEIVLIPAPPAAAFRVPLARRAGQPRPRQRLLRGHHQPGRHREGDRPRRLLRPELLRRPAGPVRRRDRRCPQGRADRPRPRPRLHHGGPPDLAVLPRPPPRGLRRPRQALVACGIHRTNPRPRRPGPHRPRTARALSS